MDKISVIVPVFNMCEHLNRIIISLLHQTFMNMEIILVDRGSSDDSLNICNTWAFLDSRIKVVESKDSALEDGLKVCTGKFVSICDSLTIEDVYMFEMLYGAIKNNDSDISIYNSDGKSIKNFETFDEKFIQTFNNGFGNKLFKYELLEKYEKSDCVLKDIFSRATKISLIV